MTVLVPAHDPPEDSETPDKNKKQSWEEEFPGRLPVGGGLVGEAVRMGDTDPME